MRFFTLIVVLFLIECSRQGCPNHDVVQHFDLQSYLGPWNEIAKSQSCLKLESGTCGRDTLYPLENKNQAHVQFTELRDGKIYSANQTLTCPNGDGNCKAQFSPYIPAGDYKLIATDYENYAIVYSCINLFVTQFELLWVMGRNRALSQEHQDIVSYKVQELGFKYEDLVLEDNRQC